MSFFKKTIYITYSQAVLKSKKWHNWSPCSTEWNEPFWKVILISLFWMLRFCANCFDTEKESCFLTLWFSLHKNCFAKLLGVVMINCDLVCFMRSFERRYICGSQISSSSTFRPGFVWKIISMLHEIWQ